VRKSATWLIQLMAVVMVLLLLLALTGLVVYLVVANPPVPRWLFPLALVLLSPLWIWVIGDTARSLRRKRPRSPAYWAPVIGRVLLLSANTIILLIAAGHPYGWTHGAAKPALTWCACLLLGAYACWTIGEPRLVARLTARAASRQGRSA
jgi:membrane protease YdiL (CAAX protease family)